MANNNDENDTVAKDLMVSVDFTLAGGTNPDRFDELLECFIENNIEDDELTEFRDSILCARRLDGKD